MARDRERAPRRLRALLGDDVVLVVVNLDPFAVQEGVCLIPPALGLGEQIRVVDALTGDAYVWGSRNYVGLGPGQAHVMEVQGR